MQYECREQHSGPLLEKDRVPFYGTGRKVIIAITLIEVMCVYVCARAWAHMFYTCSCVCIWIQECMCICLNRCRDQKFVLGVFLEHCSPYLLKQGH